MTTDTGTNKRKKGIETQNRILEVASDLFARRGFDSVSIRQITREVGIKESSLYNHFDNKEHILETLFTMFVEQTPAARPSDAELDQMLLMLQPEEVFKNILFHFGRHINPILENTAMIITIEKYKNPRAAEIYFKCVVEEAAAYYERLIRKMIARGMLKPVDARLFAEQYNYMQIALTKEYYMAKNGLADMQTVIGYMLKTIHFFCTQINA